MTPKDLQAIKRRLADLRPATWTPVAIWDKDGLTLNAVGPQRTNEDDAVCDAFFIADAPANVAMLVGEVERLNARVAELEAAIEDSAYSPIDIVPLDEAFDTLTEYFHDALLWNEPEFVQGRAAVDTVRFVIDQDSRHIAELEAQLAARPVTDDYGVTS